MFDHCTETVWHSKVKVEEGKRKAIFSNPQNMKFDVIKIDDCVVKDGIRADFLVNQDTALSSLVELKGSGVRRACEQLFASAEHANVKPLLNPKIGFLIISSRFPRFDTYVARAKQYAARKYQAGFHVYCNSREIRIEDVIKIAR